MRGPKVFAGEAPRETTGSSPTELGSFALGTDT